MFIIFHRLNSIQRVVLHSIVTDPEIFLEVHGPKLTELEVLHKKLRPAKIFDLCPNLRCLSLIVMVSSMSWLCLSYSIND